MRIFLVCTMAIACGCVAAPSGTPPVEGPAGPETPVEIEFPHERVWTAFRNVAIVGDSGSTVVPHPFTALEVLAADSGGVIVLCEICQGVSSGRVRHDEIVHTPTSPALAATGTLSEFALAIRDAAARGDTAALTRVMAPEFTFSFIGAQGVPQALGAWASDGLSTLARVPELLDQGLARGEADIWAAPPAFVETLGYNGLRLGFRRSPVGRWEWLFLIRGEWP